MVHVVLKAISNINVARVRTSEEEKMSPMEMEGLRGWKRVREGRGGRQEVASVCVCVCV